jgi:hypothetical protein
VSGEEIVHAESTGEALLDPQRGGSVPRSRRPRRRAGAIGQQVREPEAAAAVGVELLLQRPVPTGSNERPPKSG